MPYNTANINWDVFTREEHDAINKIMGLDHPEDLALGVVEMTPEKELEIQKLVDQSRPVEISNESEAMRKFIQDKREKGLPETPQSPDEEKELQKLLDEEMATKQKEAAEKIAEQLSGTTKRANTHITNVQDAKQSFCDLCDSKGVKHKKDCPKNLIIK